MSHADSKRLQGNPRNNYILPYPYTYSRNGRGKHKHQIYRQGLLLKAFRRIEEAMAFVSEHLAENPVEVTADSPPDEIDEAVLRQLREHREEAGR